MRDYENTPRPEIEHHPHIRELIESQEKRTADRNDHRAREKATQERNDLVRDARPLDLKDFWCDHCHKDFISPAIKQIEIDWTNPLQVIAFYKTKHRTCGRWCIRLITDRYMDGYWFRSKLVRRDQVKHHDDMLQPHETGFNLLYGKKP